VSNQATRLAEAKQIAERVVRAIEQAYNDTEQSVPRAFCAEASDAAYGAAIDALLALVQPAVSEEAERAAFKAWWAQSGFTAYKDTGYACWLARAQSSKGDEALTLDEARARVAARGGPSLGELIERFSPKGDEGVQHE